MGSGDRFRISLMPLNYFSIGIAGGYKLEHVWSLHIDLFKVRVYIGFGKGYEEFR